MNSNAVSSTFTYRPLNSSTFNFKTDDPNKNSDFKFGHKSSGLFLFGDQNNSSDKKTESGFNFVFGHTSSTSGSPEINAVSETSKLKISNAKTDIDSKSIQDTVVSEVLEESKEETNGHDKSDGTVAKDDDVHNQKQETNEETEKSTEDISVKVLLKEFKELINEFVKERVDNEKRIIALEEKIETLQNEVKELKNVDGKNSDKTAAKNSDTTHSVLTTQTSPLSTFNSSPTIFGSASTFSSNITPTNFLFGGTVYPSTLTQVSSGNQLFNKPTPVNSFPISFGSSITIPKTVQSETGGASTNIGLFSSGLKTGTHMKLCSSSLRRVNNTDTVPIKGNGFFTTMNNTDNEFMQKTEIKIEDPQQNQISSKVEESLVINLKESLEASLKETIKDIFMEFKKSLETEFSTKK